MLPFPSPRPGFVCGPITHCARARATGPRVPGHTATTPNTKCTVHELQDSSYEYSASIFLAFSSTSPINFICVSPVSLHCWMMVSFF